MTSITRQRDKDVRRLARAIVATAKEHRRGFTEADGLAAGFSRTDMNRLWDDAFIEAQRIEPDLSKMAVQS